MNLNKLEIVLILFLTNSFLVQNENLKSISKFNKDVNFEKLFWPNKTYEKRLRPFYQTEINLKMILKQIMNIDEKTQTIKTNSYLFVEWHDPRVAWNVTDNVKRIPGKLIHF